MKNNKLTRIVFTVLIALVMLTAFSSCDTGTFFWDTAAWGTWEDGLGSLTLTNTTYANYYDGELSYSGIVVEFDDSAFNADEESSYDTCGYLLVELTESNSAWTPVGTCFVLRWENMITEDGVTTVSFSEGYGAETFTDSAEALAGMTDADGYFNYYSTYTLSE